MSPHISHSLAQTRIDDLRRLAAADHMAAHEPRLRRLLGRVRITRPAVSRRPAVAR